MTIFLPGYSKRHQITIDHTKISEDLTHFPVPVFLSATAGDPDHDVSDIFAEVGADFSKIAVTRSDGIAQLYVEVDSWDEVAGTAVIWISAPDWTISSTEDTILFLYFDAGADANANVGEAGGMPDVWDAHTSSRYGLAQTPVIYENSIIDSTGNGWATGNEMTEANVVAGLMGNALACEDYERVTSDNGYFSIYPITIQSLVQVTRSGSGESCCLVALDNYGTANYIETGVSEGRAYGRVKNSTIVDIYSASYSVGDWLHIVFVCTSNTSKTLYVNGEYVGEISANLACPATTTLYIGGNRFVLLTDAGIMDDIVISATARTAGWIAASYAACMDSLIRFSNTQVEEVQAGFFVYVPMVSEMGPIKARTGVDLQIGPIWQLYGMDASAGVQSAVSDNAASGTEILTSLLMEVGPLHHILSDRGGIGLSQNYELLNVVMANTLIRFGLMAGMMSPQIHALLNGFGFESQSGVITSFGRLDGFKVVTGHGLFKSQILIYQLGTFLKTRQSAAMMLSRGDYVGAIQAMWAGVGGILFNGLSIELSERLKSIQSIVETLSRGDYSEANQFLRAGAGNKIEHGVLVELSDRIKSIQGLVETLSHGDSAGIQQNVGAGVGTQSAHGIVSELSDRLKSVQSIIETLSLGDHVGFQQFSGAGSGINLSHGITTELSDQIRAAQSILKTLSHGDSAGSQQVIDVGVGLLVQQGIVSELSDRLKSIQGILETLSHGDHAILSQAIGVGVIRQVFHGLSAELSDRLKSMQMVIETLAHGDHSGSQQYIGAGVGSQTAIGIVSDLSDRLKSVQLILETLSHGDHSGSQQSLNVGVGVQSSQNIISELSDRLKSVQAITEVLSHGDYTGSQQIAGTGVGGYLFQNLTAELSGNLKSIQSVLETLSRSDYANIYQEVGIGSGHKIVHGLAFDLSDRLKSIQVIIETLSNGNHAGSQQDIGAVSGVEISQGIVSELSDRLKSVQSVLEVLSRGDFTGSGQSVGAGSGSQSAQGIVSELSDIMKLFQTHLMTISDVPVTQQQSVLQTLMEKDFVRYNQAVPYQMDDQSQISYISVAAEIYLDGRPLSKRFITTEINYSEGTIHNSLTINSSDAELFAWSDPGILYGEPRIEAQIGNRVISFILDERDGDSLGFTLTGISVSAKEDGPYANAINYQNQTAMLASEIAAGLTNYCPVSWECGDWIVPAYSFEFSGYPIEGIQSLAAEIGAIVRCSDDGTLIVRKKRPVRPVYMDMHTASLVYDGKDIITLSSGESQESGYNAVEVSGRPAEIWTPYIKLEEQSPAMGDTVHLWVFWQNRSPSVLDTYVTDGVITRVGGGFYTVETIETVEFKDGAGSVDLPVQQILSVEWIGDNGGNISIVDNGKEVMIPDSAFRVAKIKYSSRYQKFEISKHNVEALIAVLYLESVPGVYVRVTTPDDPVFGPMISAELLTTDNAAVERGTAWIDENKYRKAIASIESPYLDAAIDGELAYINDAFIGYPGNYHITGSKILLDGPKTTNILELEKCLISFNP